MIECPNCDKTSSGSRCRLCGWSPAAAVSKPKVPETQQPRPPPTYPAATPDDDAQIRAAIAALHAQPWWRDTQGTARAPAIDPAIRSEVARRAGPEPVGAVVGRVLPQR